MRTKGDGESLGNLEMSSYAQWISIGLRTKTDANFNK